MQSQENRYKRIVSLLSKTQQIRNVSIVAHVDHGKTTLADCLLSSNGIIHKKQAGQLRLLDDRTDEQDRGITMKSNSICLLHKRQEADFLINLIDSPGHLQFYSEVSSALRLTDSALLVIDTVEGVSSQTYRVLDQLYREKLPAIIVLNKIDKLITHCRMQPLEAYAHLSQIIQQVNAILGSFIMKEVSQKGRARSKSQDLEEKNIDRLEDMFYFSPEKKNVVFCSALDNWGFAIQSFSGLIAKKFNKPVQEMEKYLWGDYYFNPKTKQFSDKPRSQNDHPVCVDWILKPIWDIFENVESENKEKVEKVIGMLKLKISENAKKNYNYVLIKEIMNSWLPLDKVIMNKIVDILPNPIQAQRFRLPYLLELDTRKEEVPKQIRLALEQCSNKGDLPLIIFVSKMANIPKKQFNERNLEALKGDPDTGVLGFARVFSGNLKRGDSVFLIGAKKNKKQNEKGEEIDEPQITKIEIDNLYIFNAQHPEGIEEAYAGNIIGIGNLQKDIFKSGTISSSQQCLSFIPVSSQTKSILKVSVSTENIQDNAKLLEGLIKLDKSDPSVDVYVESTGDIILNTCGQVHLQKCVVDLEQLFCKIPIKTSQPLISFRETITWLNPKENKNMKYLQELKKKKTEQDKKRQMIKYKQEMLADAEIDEEEKEKLKAIQEWDSHVEKYESEDLTVEDIRFFFKNRDDMEDKEAYTFKKQKQIKNFDHKNRGKLHTKQKFLNLNLKTNVVSLKTPNNRILIKVKALGMPFNIAEFLDKNIKKMKKLFKFEEDQQLKECLDEDRSQFIDALKEVFKEYELEESLQKLILERMICFGPNPKAGTNFLVSSFLKKQYSFFEKYFHSQKNQEEEEALEVDKNLYEVLEEYKTSPSQLLTSIKMGFTSASSVGPLCNESMMGVIFIIQSIQGCEVVEQKKENEKLEEGKSKDQKAKNQESKMVDNFGPLAGQLISTMKDSCIESFLGGSPRLVEPMYLCQLHTDQQYYGSIYNQLSKRRAKIISQDLHEFSNFFIIKAYLPMLESTNLCFEILDKTQGTVNAQLDLDTWKIFDEDPFYVPFTAEEIEENGIQNILYNHARILLQKIRVKKGLRGTEKLVVAAEKQRTLKK